VAKKSKHEKGGGEPSDPYLIFHKVIEAAVFSCISRGMKTSTELPQALGQKIIQEGKSLAALCMTVHYDVRGTDCYARTVLQPMGTGDRWLGPENVKV
jgi:hypothetical protein